MNRQLTGAEQRSNGATFPPAYQVSDLGMCAAFDEGWWSGSGSSSAPSTRRSRWSRTLVESELTARRPRLRPTPLIRAVDPY